MTKISMKTYRCDTPEVYCRVGRALVRFEFKGGRFCTDNHLFQKAIENSPLFGEGRITIE